MKRSFRFFLTFAVAGCVGIGTPLFPQAAIKEGKTPSASQTKKTKNTSIRPTSAPARTYTVKNGDNLYQIARANRTSVGALMSANGLQSNRLQVGQRLTLSGGRAKPKLPPQMPAWYKSPPSGQVAAKRADEDMDPTADAPAAAEGAAPAQTESPASTAANTQTPGISGDDIQPLRIQLASTGLGFLGVPYRRSGNSEESGFDCSGFVKSLYEKFKISLPRSSREQFKVGEKIDKDNLEVGDLVFFTSGGKVPSHVGVYIGDNQILHAARRAKQVIISSLSGSWYAKRFLGARRLQDLWADETPPAENKSN